MLFKNKKCSTCQAYFDPTLEQCPTCHSHNELYERERALKHAFFFHPAAQIGLFLAGFAYAGMIFAEIFVSIFLMGVFDEVLKTTLTVFFSYLLMFGTLMIIIFTTRWKSFFKRFTRPLDYAFGVGYAVITVITGIILGLIVSAFYKGGNNTNQSTAVDISLNYPILSGIILCFFGPVCEELTYRVGFYSFFRRINLYLAMIVSTIFFAFIHFDFTAKDIVNELWSLPSYLVSGIILGIAYEHRGPACSFTAHIVYNIYAFSMIFIDR